MEIEEQVVSPRPVEEVWHQLRDFANTVVWDPGVLAVERRSRGPIGEGTRYRVTVAMGPLGVPMDYEVLRLDDDERRVVLQGVGLLVRAIDDIAVAPAPGGGSVVTWRAVLSPRGPLAVTEPLWRPAFRQVANKAMVGLAAWLD